MIPQWKDTSSYRQGERGKVEPTSWTLAGEHVSITVHHHIGCGDAWFVSCRQAGLNTLGLEGPTIDDAKAQAVHKVHNKLRMLADDASALVSQHVCEPSTCALSTMSQVKMRGHWYAVPEREMQDFEALMAAGRDAWLPEHELWIESLRVDGPHAVRVLVDDD